MSKSRVTNTDYFPILVALANEQNEIDDTLSKGKPLEQFLAKRFSLSKPTVNSLLSTWENEGGIVVEKDVLGRFIRKIKILSISPRQKEKNKILVLIDFENLQKNLKTTAPEKFSIAAGFDRLCKQIAREIGEIINVFVFVPPHATSPAGETFHKLGFFTILCPGIENKKGKKIDTTDETLIALGKKIINQIPDLTHLCLGSGDKDFSPLVREAIRKGLKIIVVAGDLTSLSSELIKLADQKADGLKMVYLFSPTED